MVDIETDPKIVPWSYRGSYLCLAGRAGLNGSLTPDRDVYLVSHHYTNGIPLFALRPVVDDPLHPPSGFHKTPSPARFVATPSCLRWETRAGVIAEATFEDAARIRIRGSSPMAFDTDGSLRVDGWRNWLFWVPPATADAHEMVELRTSPNNGLRIHATKGQIRLTNDAPHDFNFKEMNRRMEVSSATEGNGWELVISEIPIEENDVVHDATRQRASFDQCRSAMASAFEQYVSEICSWTKAPTRADNLAAYIMWTSTVRKAGNFTSDAVLMSKLWMNKVWSWDNCFNGLALFSASTTMALDQILIPFSHITPEGRLPDSMMRAELLYDYVKPPIYGWTFFQPMRLCNPRSDEGNPAFDMLPTETWRDVHGKVAKFTAFWYDHRTTAQSAIPYYTHGNDSGWDNSTAFDRQTICVSPDLAALLVVQCDFLAKLAKHLDMDPSKWDTLRDRTLKGLLDELWSEQDGQFMFKDALDGSTWTSTTLLKFLPLVASSHLPSAIVSRLEHNLSAHLSKWGLATEQLDSGLYEPDGYWRGPIWAPPTLMIESGLRAAGKVEMANTIAERYIRLCEKSGFAENYDAVEGVGNRDLSYTWAASAYLVLRRQAEARAGITNGKA